MGTDQIKEESDNTKTKHEQSKPNKLSAINFSDLVQRINDAYHLAWEKEKLEFTQSFLARTWSGMPLPVLSICGRGTQEIRYSKYLGYFLDGTKSHGLGFRYLDELLSLVTEEKIDTYNAKTESEKWIGVAQDDTESADCFCDNVVMCNHHVIFIEQKINSGESNNPRIGKTQLLRYNEAISKNEEFDGKKLVKIFLTPTGKQSLNAIGWESVSHHDLIHIGINVLHKGGISTAARENLKRFLLDLVLGPFGKSEDVIHELVELAKITVLKPSFADRLRFDRLVSQNELLINILMEG